MEAHPAPISASDLSALIHDGLAMTAGTSLYYVETRWSLRRPISYELHNTAGEVLGTITPIDRKSRRVAVLQVGEQPVLLFTSDRSGDTAVTRADGTAVGAYCRRLALFSFHMRLCHGDHTLGELRHRRRTSATLTTSAGLVAARIRRHPGRLRRTGSSLSELHVTGVGTPSLPAAMAVAAVPALDAMRKEWRRRHPRALGVGGP